MRKNIVAWTMLAAAGWLLVWASQAGSPAIEPQVGGEQVQPATLLPASAVAAFVLDGSEKHQPAITETAAWQSLVESGFRDRLLDLLQAGVAMAGPDMGPEARRLVEHVLQHGISGAISVAKPDGELQPYATLVLHNGVAFAETLQTLLRRKVSEEFEIGIAQQTIQGREVSQMMPGPPGTGVEFSWWVESNHLVFAVGMNAAGQAIETATSATPNITANANYNALRQSDKFTVDSMAWLDAGALIDRFGDMPFPEPPRSGPISIRDFLKLLGVDNLKTLSVQSGYNGAAGWSHAAVKVDGELSGLLALMKQRNMTLDDLPALPPDCSGFFATSFNVSQGYADVLDVVRRFASVAGEHAVDDMREYDTAVLQMFGGDLRTSVLDGLGDVWCVYSDPTGMPIPIGFSPVACFRVQDRDKLMNAVDRFMPLLDRELQNEEVQVRRSWKDGNLYVSVVIPGMPIVPTIIMTEDWVVASLVPGAAQAFVLRQQGELNKWTPDERVASALRELPESFTSIAVSDPVPGYVQMLNFAPMAMSLFETQVAPNLPNGAGMRLPFGVEDLPVAQRVVEPLFPNVAVSTRTEDGVESWSRHSVPSNPIGSVGSGAAVPVLVALLLPAVQSAREAARRTQSSNNLKQLSLAMHNYHDAYNTFPRGTFENDDLEADERLSWVYSLAPYMEQTAIYQRVDKASGWQSDTNKDVANTAIPYLVNPSQPGDGGGPGGMDYVGIAGVGPNAASLPAKDRKAGIFGYDRATSLRDILDGTSNTLMFGDAAERNASWLAGGRATIRGFSQQPYLNGPDGIGSPHPSIVQFAFADGSVRAISVNVDDSVLEALATKAGGEAVNPNF